MTIGERAFRSRLLLSASHFASPDLARAAREAAGCEIVLFAVPDLPGDVEESAHLDGIDRQAYFLLPVTSGCRTSEEAVVAARTARERLATPWVALEVSGDEKTLWPDVDALLEATALLSREGFVVLASGAAAILARAAPPGSGQGVVDPLALSFLVGSAGVPVLVAGGVGSASDAAFAMELGADGVLGGRAVSGARNPLRMAEAMRDAVKAGRASFLAGRIERRRFPGVAPPLARLSS
ncbi:MAG: thiazole synthase [Acidobacteria bacterium]|nr:MAG: thiazole synthase [Acidobacteriota bacterium]